MNRITDKDITKACNDTCGLCGLDRVCKRDCYKPTPCMIPRIVYRLAEIEDILGDEYDLKRLRELVDAEKEERVIVAPARIGDKVYHITTCENFPKVYDGTLYGDDGGPGSATGLYCPCELAENCPFPCEKDGSFDCDKHRKTLAVFEDVVKDIVIGDTLDYVGLEYSGEADFEEFGKYIFSNREDAQEAVDEWRKRYE